MGLSSVLWSTLVTSSLLCFFSNSWLIIWALLELNTLAFCSILSNSWKNTENESSINYFVIQSVASSSLIIFSSISNTLAFFNPFLSAIVSISLAIKIAAAPFHKWFTEISNALSWILALIIFTWQNLAPSFLISLQTKGTPILFILASGITGALIILNNNNTNEVMGYSSVFNISWTLASLILNVNLFLFFLGIYWTSVIYVVNEIKNNNIENLSEIPNEVKESNNEISYMLNLAGMPPLIIFALNWITFSILLNISINVLPLLLLSISIINLYSYLRVLLPTISNNSNTASKLPNNYSSGGNLFILLNALTLAWFTL